MSFNPPLCPRAVQLSDSNIKLREELDQARNTTARLNEEVLRLSGELNATRQRLDTKEKEWEEKLKVCTYLCSIWAGDYCAVHVRTYVHMCVCVYTHVPQSHTPCTPATANDCQCDSLYVHAHSYCGHATT